MRRLPSILASGLLAVAMLGGVAPASVPETAAATIIGATTTCANGEDNTPGLGVICEVTILNTISSTGGSAEVTVRECHGPAGAPETACQTTTETLSEPVTEVNQCNNSTNGGGGNLQCSVEITNTYVDESPNPTDVTVNQCVGSGDDIANDCDPFPATTTNATITQCNGSANGGTLVELRCTASGTQSDSFDVIVNQCNDSTNGGGALVICSASIESIDDSAAPTEGPTAAPTDGSGSQVTPPPTDTVGASPVRQPTPVPWALVLVAGLLATAVVLLPTRRHARRR